MCRATTCRTCGKSTWSGCGQHVAQVRAGVPADQWCAGHAGGERRRRGWLSRFSSRRTATPSRRP